LVIRVLCELEPRLIPSGADGNAVQGISQTGCSQEIQTSPDMKPRKSACTVRFFRVKTKTLSGTVFSEQKNTVLNALANGLKVL
jgi:hypothetical protein